MKKALSLLLALVLCLSLCACGDKNDATMMNESSGQSSSDTAGTTINEQSSIVGQWLAIADSELSFTFREDHSGTLLQDGSTYSFNWKYDEALSSYCIVLSEVIYAKIEVADGVVQLTLSSNSAVFVRPDDYEAAHSAYLKEQQEKEEAKQNAAQAELLNGAELVEYGVPYTLTENLSITFTDSGFNDNADKADWYDAWLSFYITNTSENTVETDDDLPSLESEVRVSGGGTWTEPAYFSIVDYIEGTFEKNNYVLQPGETLARTSHIWSVYKPNIAHENTYILLVITFGGDEYAVEINK